MADISKLTIGEMIEQVPAKQAQIFWSPRADEVHMELDREKIDRAVLALLYLGLHDGDRAWKGFDWAALSRLHEKGYITDPVGKAKSVAFTEEGLRDAPRLLEDLFGKRDG